MELNHRLLNSISNQPAHLYVGFEVTSPTRPNETSPKLARPLTNDRSGVAPDCNKDSILKLPLLPRLPYYVIQLTYYLTHQRLSPSLQTEAGVAVPNFV